MKSRLSMKACSRSCCPTWAALSPSCAGSRRKGTGANIYQPLQETYRAAGCRSSRGRPRVAGAGAFLGAGRKAAGLSCGGGLLIDPACPAVLRCPMATVHAGPGAAALAVLSPAAAHPPLTSASSPAHRPAHLQEPIRGLIAGDKVLRANEEHEAPATHGSDAGTTHPAPCVWASLASSLGLGLCLDP